MSSFDNAFALLLPVEGGFTNDPLDSGGPTNFGITQADLARWRGHAVTAEDVRDMTVDEAKSIYRAFYWNAMNLDLITNDKVAEMLFDQGVNRGIRTAVQQLQLLLNNTFGKSVVADGTIGPKTAAAVNSVKAGQLIIEYVGSAENAYVNIVVNQPSKIKYLAGWINRAHELLKLLLS